MAATFLKKYTQKQEDFNGFKSERNCLNALKILKIILEKRMQRFNFVLTRILKAFKQIRSLLTPLKFSCFCTYFFKKMLPRAKTES